MKSNRLFFFIILLVLILNCCSMIWLIQDRSHVSDLTSVSCNSEFFREQFLSPSLYEKLSELSDSGQSFAKFLTATMLDGHFHPETVSTNTTPYLKYKREEFLLLKKCYEMIWTDLEYFPVSSPIGLYVINSVFQSYLCGLLSGNVKGKNNILPY